MKSLVDIYPIHTSTLDEINARAEIITLKKGEILIPSQKRCDHLYFLRSGSIKSFHLNNGNEHTSWVYFEGELLTSWHSFMLEIQSIECFKAAEKSELIAFKRADIDYLKSHHLDFVHLMNAYYEHSIGFYDYFSKKLPNSSATENYRFIQENNPMLIQRASNSDIASIIGVTRETISRVRAKLDGI